MQLLRNVWCKLCLFTFSQVLLFLKLRRFKYDLLHPVHTTAIQQLFCFCITSHTQTCQNWTALLATRALKPEAFKIYVWHQKSTFTRSILYICARRTLTPVCAGTRSCCNSITLVYVKLLQRSTQQIRIHYLVRLWKAKI